VLPWNERLTVTVNQAVEITSISRPKLYRLMQSGDLKFTIVGQRRLVLVESLRRLVLGDKAEAA
jgi:excisionase family DNA binding protein